MDNVERKDVPTWDETFMGIALLTSMRSKDPHTQVGAVIVDKNHRIMSIGYNGTPTGFDDIDFPWGRDGDPLHSKYKFVVHAERNAILNYRGNRDDFNDSILYVTLRPCSECVKEIIQAGISKVCIMSNGGSSDVEIKAGDLMMDKCGVKHYMYSPSGRTITLNV